MEEDKRKGAAQRKALERQRKKDAGFVKKEFWCRPEDWPKIETFLKKLNKQLAS